MITMIECQHLHVMRTEYINVKEDHNIIHITTLHVFAKIIKKLGSKVNLPVPHTFVDVH